MFQHEVEIPRTATLTFRLTRDEKRNLKQHALDADTSVQRVVLTALYEYLAGTNEQRQTSKANE
jgi:hypothetical protein